MPDSKIPRSASPWAGRSYWVIFVIFVAFAAPYWFSESFGLGFNVWLTQYRTERAQFFGVLIVGALIIFLLVLLLRATVRGKDPLARPFECIPWSVFEKMFAHVLRLEHHPVVEVGEGRADGGIEHIIDRASGPPVAVQCKKYYRKEIVEALLQEFVLAMRR